MLWKLPVVFVCENNGYAMGTSVERTANHTDIWKLGLGYEMPCGPVDGMNPIKVAEAFDEAIQRARRGDGPTFLEMKTYRYRGHSMSDAQHYRTKDEVEEYKKLILLLKLRILFLEKKYATEDDIKVLIKRVKTWLLNVRNLLKNHHIQKRSVCTMSFTNKKIIHFYNINYKLWQ